ncbi:MAG TPA: hypothetical protein VFK40_00050, partial [Nitrososphaeraceae archaeon]|nr:hypothetical protein [Nitrososphaeraceae archaeon]
MDQFSANTIQVHLFFVFILAAALLICIIPSLSFIIETVAEQAPYYESDERDYQYNFYEPKEKNYGNEDTYYTSQIPSSYEPEYKLHNEIDKYIQVEPTDNKDNKEIDIEKWFQQSKRKFQQKLDEEKEQQRQQEQQKDQTNEDNNGNIMLKRTYQQKLDHDKKEKEEKEKEEKEGDNSKTSYILNPHFRSFYPPIKQIVIPEIYQSVFNGEKYRFNVTNPNDEIQVDESENKKVFTQQNYDGSWRIDGGSTRIDIHTKDAGIIPDKPLQLNNILNGITVQSWNFSKLKDIGYWYKPSDWKNVEITLIFKLVDSSRSKGDQHSVSLVTRS